MNKNITGAVQFLEKNSNINKAYDNIANSAVISQRQNELEEKSNADKVAVGVINAAGTNVVAKSIMPTDIGQNKVLAAIEALMEKYPGYTDGLRDIRMKGATVLKSDNSSDYPFESIEESSGIPVPTYVASDPVRPESTVETSTSDSSSVKTSFDINNLYSDTKALNPYEHSYVDISTGRKISDMNLLSYSNEGIIVQTSATSNERLPVYRFFTTDQLEQSTIPDVGTYVNVSPYEFKDEVTGQDTLHERNVLTGTIVSRDIKYRYSYCLDEVVAEQRIAVKTAGYVSKPVRVSPNTYIELSAEVTDGIEYSIIEGAKETPILPKDVDQITDEKLFFGMMPRFVIMNPDNIVVKRNGIPTGIVTQRELEAFIMADITSDGTGESTYTNKDTYTVTYKPAKGARRYFATTDSVKIKVIQRMLDDQVPKRVGSIKLLQYNVTGSWYLSSTRYANSFAQENRTVG